MKRLNHSGMTGITALLILAAVLLVIGGGVFVYSKNHHGTLPFGGSKATPVVYTDSGNSTSPNGIPGGATGVNPNAVPVGGNSILIRIPDAGLQMTVPSSLKDLTSHTVKDSGGRTVITFSTQSLTNAVPGCAADKGRGAFDVVVKGNGTYPGPAPYSGAIIKQYSGFYTAYELPTGPCAKGLSQSSQVLLDDQAQDFYGTLQSVQPL